MWGQVSAIHHHEKIEGEGPALILSAMTNTEPARSLGAALVKGAGLPAVEGWDACGVLDNRCAQHQQDAEKLAAPGLDGGTL